MKSIRSKILLVCVGLATAVVAMALFAWADLRFVERKIGHGRLIDRLREQTQEMRRHEKNTLLYRLPEEKQLALALTERLLLGLARGGPAAPRGASGEGPASSTAPATAAGDAILDAETRAALINDLRDYAARMAEVAVAAPPAPPHPTPRDDAAAEDALRMIGHRISTHIDTLSERGSAQLNAALNTSRRALVIFASAIFTLVLVVAFLLVRVVVLPLRQLELNLRPLAQGQFDSLPQVSGDREMVSLIKALSRMLDELERRRRQVLQADRLASLGVLAAGVAHELNNPLGNISAAAQILREEVERDTGSDLSIWTTQIDTESTRAQQIVRTLLDYAQRRNFEPRPVAVKSAIESALALLRNRFRAANTVRLNIPDGARIHADPQRLQQVFINLIGNALGADPSAQPVQVDITACSTSAAHAIWPPSAEAFVVGALHPETRTVVISVCDDGPGIDPAVWPKVFDPFFTTREPGQGVGLGLFVVAEILHEHSAAIAVDRAPQGGARFCLAFPAAPGESP